MKIVGVVTLLLLLSGCAVCSSSDNAEQCRTKQRDRSHPRTDFAAFTLDRGLLPARL